MRKTNVIDNTVFLSDFLRKIPGVLFEYAGHRYPGPYLAGDGVTGSYLIYPPNEEAAFIPDDDETIELQAEFRFLLAPIRRACDDYTEASGKSVTIIIC